MDFVPFSSTGLYKLADVATQRNPIGLEDCTKELLYSICCHKNAQIRHYSRTAKGKIYHHEVINTKWLLKLINYVENIKPKVIKLKDF